ncbi:MAG: hypothetical protein ABSC64_11025 [Candidatus Korobacteraceae bacterium]|jgi:hypothetical protein
MLAANEPAVVAGKAASISYTRLLRVLDVAVLGSLATLVLFTVSKHEPWADEAQSWLLARDLGWWRLIFSELRYEGHPGVWHTILWVAIHIFHVRYEMLGYLGGMFAIGGLAVLIFLAPFPRVLRYLIATSYFFVYQYAVIARSYELLPLLAFLAAYLFRKRTASPVLFAMTLSLLAHVSIHGTVIALALGVPYGLRTWRRWPQLATGARRRVTIAGLVFGVALMFLVVVLYPPPDTVAMAEAGTFTFQQHAQKTLFGVAGSICDFPLASLLVLILACIWSYERGSLLVLIIGMCGTGLIYGFLRGAQHHQGLILLSLVTGLWVGWPSPEEQAALQGHSLYLHRIVLVTFIFVFAWQLRWSYTAIRNDWAGSYSGARDTAMFLKSVHADEAGCSGFLYWTVGVQPYFPHNIFENLGGPSAHAYIHNSVSYAEQINNLRYSQLKSRFLVFSFAKRLAQVEPLIQLVNEHGYRLVYYANGSAFFKDRAGEPQLYLVFERVDPD